MTRKKKRAPAASGSAPCRTLRAQRARALGHTDANAMDKRAGGAGSRGDLVLLDADPLPHGSAEEQARQLRDMQVAGTWVAGREVFTPLD